MEEELLAKLLATSAITAIASTRIAWGEHRQGTPLPAIVLMGVSGFEGVHMNGAGPYEARVQVDCYAMTYAAAKLLSRAVIDALHTYRGGGFLFIEQSSTRDSREG